VSDVIVLCYHALSASWQAELSTTPARFERQIALLVGRGYRCVTFSEAVAASDGGRVVAITFDDAYRSVIELAHPILDRFAVPATVFVPTDYIGAPGPLCWPGIDRWLGGDHEAELAPMSWLELRSLAAAGWEMGSHTASHPHLTQLEEGVLAGELERSKAACEEHLAQPCTSLAYPYGDVDARVAAATARAGYLAAAGLPHRLHSPDPMNWPRVGIYCLDDDLRFRLKVSPTARRVRGSAAWDSLDALRRRLKSSRANGAG
jgi:peptidoglycan/xylan/chitin deacetylase (PgdA/CDA1 family)